MSHHPYAHRCPNCAERWSSRAVARACCARCERVIPIGDNRATQCGNPRVWSAPYGDARFPLGYCDQHMPADIRGCPSPEGGDRGARTA